MQRQLLNATGNWSADVETLQLCLKREALFNKLTELPFYRLQASIRKCFWEVNPDIRMDIRTR